VNGSAQAAARLDPLQFGLVAASVLAAILPHLWRLPPLFSALVLALFIGRAAQRLRGGGRLPGWIKLPLVLIFPIFIIVHYGNIFGREPGSALACAMLVLKLVETDSRRDARAAICFASFVLMSALLFDSGLAFALLLFATLALFLATLRELGPRAADAAVPHWRQRLRADLRGGAVALLSALPLALCGFLFFPRLAAPLWGTPRDNSARTGLGDSMTPGVIGQLLTDETPAFRVTFDGTPPPHGEFYWRGPVLWHFDGRAWTRPEYFSGMRDPVESKPSGATVSYDVTLEPTAQRWMLALDIPLDVPQGAVRGADMSLVSRSVIDHLLRYHVTSAPHYRFEPVLERQHRQLALDLPPDFDPQARELARRWRRELGSDDKIINAALALFHNEFFYTMDAPELARDSVDDFLFGSKSGWCEHFASSFTFLIRAAGIPARVVTGYQGGYYVKSGGYYLIRQSDAHAWSEVWLEGRGWVRVDPTAAVSPQRVSLGSHAAAGASARWYQADWLLEVRNQLDLVNSIWNSAVVQFNVLRQQQLLTPFGIDKAEYTQLMTVLIATSSLLLGLFAWWTLRAPRDRGDPLDSAYRKLCRKLARAGAERTPAEGPLAFSARLGAGALHSAELEALLHDYARLRYACELPPARAVRAFARGVAALRVHAAAIGAA
jgi:transglutaminase-like putative cysteine protease